MHERTSINDVFISNGRKLMNGELLSNESQVRDGGRYLFTLISQD